MQVVIIPFDDSDPAQHAVETYLKLASQLKAPEAVLVHVEPGVSLLRRVIGGQPTDLDALEQPARKAAEKMLEAPKARLQAAGLAVRTRVAFGEPAECIADYAREAKADLIVMGTSGRSAIKGMLIGSVARKLLHLTHVPVMLVR